MVESKAPNKALQKSLAQITKESGNLASVGDVTLQAVSKVLVQTPDRWDRPTVEATLDTLFQHAST